MDIEALQQRLREFADERDWEKFHSPKNLVMAMSVEMAELVEHFQWRTEEESLDLDGDIRDAVALEMADILIYMLRMADRSDGHLVYALASYNAGPGNCDKWRRRFPNHSTEAFIQAIPFSETKGYVKKVLGNYAAYHSLYPPQAN